MRRQHPIDTPADMAEMWTLSCKVRQPGVNVGRVGEDREGGRRERGRGREAGGGG